MSGYVLGLGGFSFFTNHQYQPQPRKGKWFKLLFTHQLRLCLFQFHFKTTSIIFVELYNYNYNIIIMYSKTKDPSNEVPGWVFFFMAPTTRSKTRRRRRRLSSSDSYKKPIQRHFNSRYAKFQDAASRRYSYTLS